jgi:hypothetical protein
MKSMMAETRQQRATQFAGLRDPILEPAANAAISRDFTGRTALDLDCIGFISEPLAKTGGDEAVPGSKAAGP